MKAHPAAERYPLMPESELAQLVADMKQNGFDKRFPIARLKGKTLDGRNREIAAERAGVKAKFIDLPKDTDPDAYVIRANEHRRHLSQEWLQQRRAERVERVADARRSGQSLPAIAEEEEISVAQVRRDLEKADDSGLPGGKPEPKNGTVTGRDGKKQKAKKTAPAESDSEAAWVDAWGIPITKEAAAAFKDQEKFDELLKKARECQRLFKDLAESPGGKFLQQPFVSKNTRDGFIHNGLATFILNVADCRPTYTVCPYAFADDHEHGKKCNLCHGLGWIGQVSKTNGPPEKLIEKAKNAHGVAG